MAAFKPVLMGLLFSALPVGAAFAQPQTPRQLTVTGYGEVTVLPDEAVVSAGVTTEAPDAQSALAKNNAKMGDIFATLARTGIPKADIRTSELALFPDYGTGASRKDRILSYRATNVVTVTVPERQDVGSVVDGLVKAGANRIDGVRFLVSKPAPFLARARAKAVDAAMRAAKTYARAAGVRLGPIQSIAAGSEQPPQPFVLRTMALAQTPVAPGLQKVEASLTISWALR